MKRAVAATDGLTYGASPRVFLLPPQIEEAQRAIALRRRMFVGLILAVMAVFLGVGAVSVSLIAASSALATEQAQTAQLVAQQSKYSSLTAIKTQLRDIETAQPVAALGEILWSKFASGIDATLPTGTTLSGIGARLDPTSSAADAPVPLQGAHVATVVLTAESPQATISDWLDKLALVKGVVNATPGSVALDESTGRYTVTVTLNLNEAAVANQYGKVR